MIHVRVQYEQEDGTWVATSPDVARWTAVADSLGEVRQLAEDGVRFALEREDVVVEHVAPAAAA